MAGDNQQERTESATPKRHNQAREKGQVPRSRELNTMSMLLAGAAGLMFLGPALVESLAQIMRASFAFSRAQAFDPSLVGRSLWEALAQAFLGMAPLFALLIVVAVASSVAVGGVNFSTQALAPNFGRLNPVAGMKRLFHWRGATELAKALVKFALVGSIAAWWLWTHVDDFLALGEGSLEGGALQAASLMVWSFLVVAAGTVVVAAVDVPLQLWQHGRELRMTKQEVKDEMKELEGRPEVKGRLRRKQRELAQRRMMQEVPNADVVVTNPTHFAVALKYEPNRMRAPKVVAKGTDLVALSIRRLGEAHRVPVFEAPPLARALYWSTELNREIPGGLYLAVAQVLAYVYQLRHPQPGAQAPARPTDLPVPDDLKRAH
jgi:flagellar biosynthetic protein FlhB